MPDQPSIFFHGGSQLQVAFGNGWLCVGTGIVHSSVVMAVGNSATYTYDNSVDFSAHVSTTRNFQHWFRDPVAGGAAFNTSNGLAIPILP